MPDVVVSGDFYVVMYTDSTNPEDDVYPDTGVEVCYDKSYSSDRAYVVWDNVLGWGEKTLTWDLSTPQETTNWMIRVVGTGGAPPELTITSHNDGDTAHTPLITVTGTSSDPSGIASVTVNGALASGAADWSTWSAEVVLTEGDNTITVVATNNTGGSTTKTITVWYGTAEIYVNESGWWRDGGAFNPSSTPIQAAVDAANTGEVIIVESGTYPEHVVIGKQVTLKGVGYPVIDGEGTGTVVTVTASGVCIEGFEVMRCDSSQTSGAAGIRTAPECIIDDCIFRDNNIGLSTGGGHNLVANCTFEDDRIGLVICEDEYNTVENNHFVRSNLILDKATNNLIKNNTIEYDHHFGINIYNECDSNTIVENTLRSNSWGAIEIADSCWGSTSHNNLIYHNNIIDNGGSCQVYDDGNNPWDDGTEGNYWSDYEVRYPDAEEMGDTGIWDTPYAIDGGSGARDNYPLVEQWGDDSDDTTLPELEITSHENGDTVYTATITVAGTASDASGIASVTVDGVLASGAADWSTWSAEVTLAEGENPIIVVATDGAGLTTTKMVTVTYSPIVVDAEITDLHVEGDGFFERGETVTVAVTVENIGSVGHEFYVGFSVYDPDGGHVEKDYDALFTSVYLDPGDNSTKNLAWTIPIGAAGGHWDVTVAVWDREEEGALYGEYDRKTEDDAFFVNDPVDKYAILIGINDYPEGTKDPKKTEDLRWSLNSVSAMYNLLNIRYGFPGGHIQMLTEDEATETMFKNAFNRVVEEEYIDSNDIFVFYFAGHGGLQESTGKEGIHLQDNQVCFDHDLRTYVDEKLRKYHDPTAIVILDSCHSGGMAYDTDTISPRDGVNGDKTIMLMAANTSGTAGQSENLGMGVFTHYLHDALVVSKEVANSDDDPRISLEEAFAYASPLTTKYMYDNDEQQHPQIMDHYLTSAYNSAQCYLDVVDPTSITAVAGCPIHLHAYDSDGRHTGMNSAGDDVESEIPGSCYSGPEFDPETIVVLGQSDNITYRIEALNDGEFNFTVVQTTDTKTTTIHYENVSITETTNATIVVNSSNPSYTMELDYDGDGTIDNTTEPTHTLINYAPNVSITTPAGVQSGDITISYTLTDSESDNCTIMAQYSIDNIIYLDASVGVGGDGMINLTSTPAGVDHKFVWASGTDIPQTNATVYFRIRPYDGDLAGDYATTDAFSVDNRVRGDLNHDGNVTPADAAIALQIAVSGEYVPEADIDGNGCVTSLDALMIMQAAAGRIAL